MIARRMVKIQLGLVFAIPLDQGKFGFGQIIVGDKTLFYMAAFDVEKSAVEICEDELEKSEIIALGFFFDVLIKNKRWLEVAILPPRRVPFPCFKVKVGDQFYVENWDGTKSRRATMEELNALNFRANMGPIILEIAVKKHLGFPSEACEPNDLISQQLAKISPRYVELVSDFV